MRTVALRLTALTFTLALSLWAGRAVADEAKLEGKWKVVVLAFGEDEFVIVNAQNKDGQLAGEVVKAQQLLGTTSVKKIEQKGTSVNITLAGTPVDHAFVGAFVTEGDQAGKALGTFRYRGVIYPARLEKTDADTVAALSSGPITAKLREVRQVTDAKSKVAALEALIKEHPGAARTAIFPLLFESAEGAGLTEAQIQKHIDGLLTEAKQYGELYLDQCRTMISRGLSGKKSYAGIALNFALDAEKKLAASATAAQKAASAQTIAKAARQANKIDLADKYDAMYAALNLEAAQAAEKALPATASPESKESVLRSLAAAAKLAGKADLAKDAGERLAKIEAELDEKYHKEVPPFQPETFAGRSDAQKDRVVLMELFTGAQCPPCVAADVAFDALLSTYKGTEFIGLQYHLHIPGPDPLTNKDTVARGQYYGTNSTPSTYFNGASQAPGGGGMANAQKKYNDYRSIIDAQLAESKAAKIELKATRSGDEIMITAIAQANDKDRPKLRLRLALTEEAIRYVGGNRLRFHHHVVRALPGGIEGKELAGGQCEVNLSVKLDDVRKEISDYIDSYAASRPFPGEVPAIKFEGLSVVAFVQDDSDKSVLHAVSVPVADK